jgi:hypothetical protein
MLSDRPSVSQVVKIDWRGADSVVAVLNVPWLAQRRNLANCPSRKFELRVALHKFFRAASGETHGHSAVVIIAFDADHRPGSIRWVANFSSQHRMRI